jgi:hypothetical protein
VEADLTFDRAKALAIVAETAARDAEELRKQPTRDVNKLRASASRTVKRLDAAATTAGSATYCTRCGKKNHT